jgi:hypothetical protein
MRNMILLTTAAYIGQMKTFNKKGTKFNCLTMSDQAPIVRDLPDTALGIFQSLCPENLVWSWVDTMNERLKLYLIISCP